MRDIGNNTFERLKKAGVAVRYSLEFINQLEKAPFVELLGWVFEHSPWVAEQAWVQRPFASLTHLHQAMTQVVREKKAVEQVSLLRAHPDLATRLQMSEISQLEQQGVGLDRLSPAEFNQFTSFNNAYVAKFNFPFIMAVRGQSKETILAAMEERLANTLVAEHEQALQEIYKITQFRLADFIEA
jgi:2-oxo-4-hydroxy-4-carboxy-5-ureidoimidazoline decarboxylase